MRNIFWAGVFCALLPGVGHACGEPAEIALNYRLAVLSNRAEARSGLVASLIEPARCLAERGGLDGIGPFRGRYAVAIRILAELRRQSLRFSSDEEIDEAVAKWSRKAPSENPDAFSTRAL